MMATRSCPNCGTQYVATVRRCIDCDANLVDEVAVDEEAEPVRSAAKPASTGTEVGYELEGWGNQLKVTLEGMLDRAKIPRVWEAGALVVPAAHEGAVDDLIATLEGGDLSELQDDVPRVALEIEGLDADGAADLDARLIGSGVPHAWDEEGALVVAEADEESVMAIIEAVLEGGDEDDLDPLAAQQALSELYVAVDRLLKRPTDLKLVAAYVAAAEPLPDLSVPYGFAAAGWQELVTDAAELVALLDGDQPPDTAESDAGHVADDDGAVDARIRDLRDRLSDIV